MLETTETDTTDEAVQEQPETTWSLESHLSELRTRLIVSIVCFIVIFGLSLWMVPSTLLQLQSLAPKGSSFFQIKPGELFFVYFKVALFLSFILSAPILLYQTAAFIWPGLKLKEKQIAVVFFVGGPLLFLGGMSFAYFVALKPMLAFLLGFGVDLKIVEPHYSLDFYVSLVTAAIVVFGLAFQLPIMLFIAALLDLITSVHLIKFWKEAIFATFVLAAILTPTPDPFNMSILGLALASLYGLSLLSIKLIGK